MKTLQNNFTTPEQSNRLLEIGVPRWSADEYRDQKGYRHSLEGILDIELFFQNFPDYLPCWSVGRLIEIFLLCTPYKEISLHCENLVEQMVVSIFMVHKDNLIDFSKLED